MLILIGAAPTAYALNRTMQSADAPAFVATVHQAEAVFAAHSGAVPAMTPVDARRTVGDALRAHDVNKPPVYAALGRLSTEVEHEVASFGGIKHIPAAVTPNMRNDMYLCAEATRLLQKSSAKFTKPETLALKAYAGKLEAGTRFIPNWVKVVVAFALGLGTMVGWKRIVVTVGERIGKTHLTYAQGASAELVAAVTIMAAEQFGLPVSTTHILSSGVAGTMAANGSGLQWSTVRSIAMAWVLTLPAAIALAGSIYFILRQLLSL